MPKNSNSAAKLGSNLTAARNSSLIWRVILGVLVVGNLAAVWFVMNPVGGSPEQLEQQLKTLQTQVAAKSAVLKRSRAHVVAVEKGRSQGDDFLNSYFLARRTAYATLLTELLAAADQAQIKPREHAYATDPIEGSDNLSMMTITANYEGTYSNLMRFVSAVDRSPRLLIIEGLTAAPQANGGVLSVNMKIDAFVREDGSGDLAPIEQAPNAAPTAPLHPPASTSVPRTASRNTAVSNTLVKPMTNPVSNPVTNPVSNPVTNPVSNTMSNAARKEVSAP